MMVDLEKRFACRVRVVLITSVFPPHALSLQPHPFFFFAFPSYLSVVVVR